MNSFIGIDLGTTFSALARIDETGHPVIVHNGEGNNLTPSCVAFENALPIVGEEARRMWKNGDGNAKGRFKRYMGTSEIYRFGDKKCTPAELSTLVLKKLIDDTHAIIGNIEEVVVTIPANFSHNARTATLEAAKAANLHVRYIVNEPTAAALYYAHCAELTMPGIYAVYDFGGGTFDISIVKVERDKIEVLASNGIHDLGGMDLDEQMAKIVKGKYEEETGETLDPSDYDCSTAEEDKHSLSKRVSVKTKAINRHVLDITRQEFEKSISLLVDNAEEKCKSTIEEAGLNVSDIREVLCAGGSTRIPIVRESIKRAFGIEPTIGANVDEVVAKGAALYAAIKGDRTKLSDAQKAFLRRFKVVERTAKSYGVIASKKNLLGQSTVFNSILIKKNTVIPYSKTRRYQTKHADQNRVDFRVTEGESNTEDLAYFDGTAKSVPLPLSSGHTPKQDIKVTFSYNDNQIMECDFVDIATGNKQNITIRSTDSARTRTVDRDVWISAIENEASDFGIDVADHLDG